MPETTDGKVIALCVSSGSYHLTVGKRYELTNSYSLVFDYDVFNDKGVKHGVERNLFVDLREVRSKKLELLISEND